MVGASRRRSTFHAAPARTRPKLRHGPACSNHRPRRSTAASEFGFAEQRRSGGSAYSYAVRK